MNNNLINIDKALELNYNQNLDLHKKYVNSGLVTYFSLVNFYRLYVKAEGSFLWDDQGNKYVDFLAGYGSLNVGHNHPKILEAVKKAAGMPNLIQATLNPLTGALAHNLAQITPGSLQRSFFCNSGTEAVEAAIKLAKISTGREKIVYCDRSFHGKTMGSLSVTGREKYQRPFDPLLSCCSRVPFGDTEALEEVFKNKDVAGFIVEPIQGEGGIFVPPKGYLKKVRESCDRYGTLLIMDEIQTGLGRTGSMFACEYEEVVPDILCLAKSLGGGIMPIGAIITSDSCWQKAYGSVDKCLIHTSTFGGNAWAAAAAIAALDIIQEEELVQQASEKGEYLFNKLQNFKEKYNLVEDIRGRGLLIGLEFRPVDNIFDKFTGGVMGSLSSNYTGAMIAGELLNKYRILAVYTLNNPNVIRLEPPLNIGYEQLDYVLDSLEEILDNTKGFLSLALKSSKNVFKSFTRRK
ncbi:MAG: putrescine aminotransferase [Firmicutes bacterium HGW-Firmicutes-13]|nr:MAG: putrescine aminotransferase [Firmicutes bacterium HGW-Firmicutes-13]